MEEIVPWNFILLLLSFFSVIIALVFAYQIRKANKMKNLIDPKRDHIHRTRNKEKQQQ